MTKKQMLAACVALAPDFKIAFQRIAGEEIVAGTCTFGGKRLELSNAVGGWGRAKVETQLLEACLASLRERAASDGPRQSTRSR